MHDNGPGPWTETDHADVPAPRLPPPLRHRQPQMRYISANCRRALVIIPATVQRRVDKQYARPSARCHRVGHDEKETNHRDNSK